MYVTSLSFVSLLNKETNRRQKKPLKFQRPPHFKIRIWNPKTSASQQFRPLYSVERRYRPELWNLIKMEQIYRIIMQISRQHCIACESNGDPYLVAYPSWTYGLIFNSSTAAIVLLKFNY